MSAPLAGKHAFISGGGKGIGASIAEALSAEGAALTLTGRDEAALKETAARLPGARITVLDVTDEAAVKRAVAGATEAAGPVDILVNNAGIAISQPFLRMTLDDMRRMMEVNCFATVACTQAVLPAMKERNWGRVLNVASLAGIAGAAYIAGYAASKHAVIGVTRSLALEVIKTGITVNAICPGYVETDMVKRGVANIMEKTGMDEAAARAELAKQNPQGRIIQPEEVGACARWLCVPGSESITGQSISITGGAVM